MYLINLKMWSSTFSKLVALKSINLFAKSVVQWNAQISFTYTSTLSTLTPHGSVASSKVACIMLAIPSRSDKMSPRFFVPKTFLKERKRLLQTVWPDWAIYWTLGPFLKPLATINLPKSHTFLGNFVKVSKSFIFLVKLFLGKFYRHLAIFFLVTLITKCQKK